MPEALCDFWEGSNTSSDIQWSSNGILSSTFWMWKFTGHCYFVFILEKTGFYCIWYLFLSFVLGLNGLNFLFPTNQASAPVSLPSSRLPSLNVPCMMVPSTALAPFPLIYSSAGTSQLHSSSSASFPNVSCVNFSMPGLTSTTPVFIGTPAVLTPNSSQIPTLEPHQQFHSAVHLNPLLGSACNSVKTDSSICMGHPVTLLNLPQVRKVILL